MSPSETSSPTATSIFQTVPVMWASTLVIWRGRISGCGSGGAASPRAGPPERPSWRRSGPGARHSRRPQRGRPDRARRSTRCVAALPGAELWVADDASEDGTAEVALAHGARVVSRGAPARQGRQRHRRRRGRARRRRAEAELVLLCDGDLGASARELAGLVEAVERGDGDLAIAAFRRRVGGGFGIALRFARWAIRQPLRLRGAVAPISGQRAMRVEVLRAVLPFAAGYGMEIGMTVDAVRAGYRVARARARARASRHRAHPRRLRAPRPPAARLRPRLVEQAAVADSLVRGDPRDRPGDDRDDLPRLRPRRAGSAAAPTASSASTSRAPAGSSTTPTRSGR